MAESAEEHEEGEPAPLGALTTEIVAAYVAKNAVAIAVLGHVIETVGRALAALGREQPEPDTAKPKPAVPVRRSIHEDHLVCLVCGKPQKVLRRHLDRAHQLTPETYRERFGLKPDYPMLAPDYARQRSEAAKRVGLGQRIQAPSRGREPRSGA
jgi:predicted transcriptional regulator